MGGITFITINISICTKKSQKILYLIKSYKKQ